MDVPECPGCREFRAQREFEARILGLETQVRDLLDKLKPSSLHDRRRQPRSRPAKKPGAQPGHPPLMKTLVATTLKQVKVSGGRHLPNTQAELLREARKKLTNASAPRLGKKFCLHAYRHTFANGIAVVDSPIDARTQIVLFGLNKSRRKNRLHQAARRLS